MILKFFELNKINQKIHKLILFHGKNEGLKNEEIQKLSKKKENKEILKYEERDILLNEEEFINDILSKSLFYDEKLIIINHVSNKIFKIIELISLKEIDDILIILNADDLEKKSKLRTLFEKDKKFLCVAFYADNSQTLSKLTYNFLNEKKISLSQVNINLVIDRCNGDRMNLKNELKKIELFALSNKKITAENIFKLTNLIENHSISELVDNCLAKNKNKIISILNENSFKNEECILITRTFLNKSKRVLKLSADYEDNKDIDLTISSAKPPIFWKDKEIVKQQILRWETREIKELIYNLNDIELRIKKNLNNSISLITNFILEQCSLSSNN